jgi:hypothetical protein
MPNSIELFKQYLPLLDEVYKTSSLTSVLDGASELMTQGANANELIIQKMSMDGLGDYDRNSGYVKGNVSLTNETVKCNFDRGRMFSVDNMDNAETAGMAYGRLAAEFIRTKVNPELDAFRFATYAAITGIGVATGALATGEAALAAVAAAYDKMTDDEVPESDRHLFITSTLRGLIRDLDTTKSKEIMSKFASVTTVPQTRFYTAIEQKSGGSGEEAGGYAKATGGVNINFMIIHKPAVIQHQKHVAPKVITPEQNQDADAWKFGYRNVGIADAYENKAAGIYLHKAQA